MARQDPNPPATQSDTTGAGGFPTAQSGGTQYQASDADTGGTEIGGSGSRLPSNDFPGVSGGGAPETAGGLGGVSGPATDTSLTGTTDTIRGGGGVGSSADPAYRAPGADTPETQVDTSRTDTPVSSGTHTFPSGPDVTGGTRDTSAWGGPVQASTGTNVPGAPTGVSAVRRPYGALVKWTAPTPVVGAPTRGFLVRSSTGRTQRFPANVTSGLMDTLDPDVAETFTVAAENANGVGPFSSASAAVTPYNPGLASYPTGQGLHVPGAPSISNVTTPGSGKAVVTFTPPADDGGADITNYSAISTAGNKTGAASGSPITVASLTPGTEYAFKVRATNLAGWGAYSNASNAVTAA